jgi:hypothetical protein
MTDSENMASENFHCTPAMSYRKFIFGIISLKPDTLFWLSKIIRSLICE